MKSEKKERKESKLSGLLAQKRKLTDKITETEKKQEAVAKELEKLKEQLAGVEDGIHRLEDRPVWITTHALNRYRERVGPADISEEEVRKIIFTPLVIKAIDTLGNCTVPLAPDSQVYLVIEDRKVITILHGKEDRH